MRLKYTVAVLLIAVVATLTMPVIGQEEPLPAPSIALAVDPIRDLTPPRVSLVDAARANDYATFDALYREEPSPAFAALHELWTFSMTDPVGAFYGEETYARLASAYPGFARYIDEYRIVDSNGNVFYPTSETRAFLLDRAVEGRPTPRVQLASGTPASPPAERAASRRRRTFVKARVEVPPAPAVEKAAPPKPAPVQVAARDAATSAGEDAGAPKTVQAAAVADNNFGTRGIFLLLIGIFGSGILALMLRTPRELPASIMEPQPPVESIKRPSAVAQPQPPPAQATEKNRASGSRG
ncbi:MAG: hypothetical protein ACJ74H_10310 [Thermoanaerobaculia bacterium]